MFLYSYVTFILLSCLPLNAIASDSGDEFSNNIFTDLAPFLTLFGEQVANQFLSQSMGWADNLIFAMAPLGIITAIVAAIRVGGPAWLRAIIGRAGESQGVAEREVMSSTSASVCELWNGQAVVRVLGSPKIIELVYLERNDKTQEQRLPNPPLVDVFSFEESKLYPSETDPLYHQKKDQHWFANPSDNNGGFELLDTSPPAFDPIDLDDRIPNPCPPNISLNARGETASQGELWSVAVLGFIIQSSVITYWGLITKFEPWLPSFHKNGRTPGVYAFPMTTIGTIAVVSGMLICSHVVEAATVEENWKAKEDEKMSVKFAWLQKGQIVNDEHFDSYAIFCQNKQTIVTSRITKNPKKFQSLVVLGTVVSIIGFVAQFMGLRGMHWSAAIAQLAATALMTTLRAIVRRHLTRSPAAKKVVKNFELDCMAREIVKCERFSIPSGRIKYSDAVDNRYNFLEIFSPQNNFDTSIPEEGFGKRLIQVRGRLNKISGWTSNFHNEISALCDAIEQTMEFISDPVNQLTLVEGQFRSVPELSSGHPMLVQWDLELSEFTWSLIVNVKGSSEDPERFERIEFNLKRHKPREVGEQWGKWKVNRSEIEAAYSLGMLDFHELEMRSLYRSRDLRQREDLESQEKTLRILGFGGSDISLAYARCLYDWWIARETKCIEIKSKIEGAIENDILPSRVLGSMEAPLDDSDSMLAVISNTPLEKLCAQHIFSTFLSSASVLISSIPGEMTVRRYKRSVGPFGIMHSGVEKIAQILLQVGLATLEDAYMSIIPPLAEKLPSITEVQRHILQIFKQNKRMEASTAVKIDTLFWFSFTCHVTARSCTKTRKHLTSYMLAANAYHKAAEACFLVLGEDDPRTHVAITELLRAIKIVVFKAEARQFLFPKEDLPELRSWYLGITNWLTASFPRMNRDIADSFTIAGLKIRELHQVVFGTWAHNSDSFYCEENRSLIAESLSAERWNKEQEQLKETWGQLEGNVMADYDRAQWSQTLRFALSNGYDAVSELLLESMPDAVPLDTVMEYGSITSELLCSNITLLNAKCLVGEFAMRSASHTFDVDSVDENGQTALCRTVYFNHYHLAEFLLETHGADINKEDKSGWSPIFTAANLGHYGILQLLLERGAIPNGHYENGNTCLHVVASQDFFGMLEILLDPNYRRTPIDPTNDFGETPLHFAARGGYLTSVCFLLNMGAFVDTMNNEGLTPLAYATASGDLDVVLALLERGANPEAIDQAGESIILIATKYRHCHIVAALLERRVPPHWICVQIAANSGDDEIVELFLTYLLSVRFLMGLPQQKFFKLFKSKDLVAYLQQQAKDSLLRIAVRQNPKLDLIKSFIGLGANPFAPDGYNSSALSLGVEQGNHDLILLLFSGIDHAATNPKHLEFPLRIAVERGDEWALDILLYAGATVSDNHLIALSTRLGHFVITRRLFALGLRLNNDAIVDLLRTSVYEGSITIFGILETMQVPIREIAIQESSLHLAAKLGKDDIVSALLLIGVDVDSRSHNDWTALQLAANGGHLSVVRMLIEAGAHTHLKNRYRWSAISLARARQFREIEYYIASMQSNDPTDLGDDPDTGSEILGLEDFDPWNDIFELDTGPQLVGDQEVELDFQLAPAVDAFPTQSFEMPANPPPQATPPVLTFPRGSGRFFMTQPPQQKAPETISTRSGQEIPTQRQHPSSQKSNENATSGDEGQGSSTIER